MKKLVLSLLVVLLAWSFFSVSYAKEKKNEREQDIIVTYVEREKTDLLKFVKNWRQQEETYKKKVTDIEKDIDEVMKYSKEYNIDPFFIIAVSLQETHGGLLDKNSSAKFNNLFGIISPRKGGYRKFESTADSIYTFSEMIERKYLKNKLNTVISIEKVYCPGDQGWAKGIIKMYKLFDKEKEKSKTKNARH